METTITAAAWATTLLMAAGLWGAGAMHRYGQRSTMITMVIVAAIAHASALGAGAAALLMAETPDLSPMATTALMFFGGITIAALSAAARRSLDAEKRVRRAINCAFLVAGLEAAISAPPWLAIQVAETRARVDATHTVKLFRTGAESWTAAWSAVAIASLNVWLLAWALQARAGAKRRRLERDVDNAETDASEAARQHQDA